MLRRSHLTRRVAFLVVAALLALPSAGGAFVSIPVNFGWEIVADR